jgi:hypothetical protein
MGSAAAAEAAMDFKRARRRADLREVLSALGARPAPLLSYDDVRRRLHAVESPARYLEDVPLDAIVGSVGRTVDFTREFLPRTDSDKARWVGVKVAMTGLTGTPPVDLYRIGEAYFVRDGNHRVSVARQLGARFIQAYVTPVHARVPLSADVSPDDLIIAEEHARFLESTELDELRPGADLRVTTAGAFERLLDHISVHRYYMGIDEDREVAYPEAVAHWYDTVYLPVREAIRSGGVLRASRDGPRPTSTCGSPSIAGAWSASSGSPCRASRSPSPSAPAAAASAAARSSATTCCSRSVGPTTVIGRTGPRSRTTCWWRSPTRSWVSRPWSRRW